MTGVDKTSSVTSIRTKFIFVVLMEPRRTLVTRVFGYESSEHSLEIFRLHHGLERV